MEVVVYDLHFRGLSQSTSSLLGNGMVGADYVSAVLNKSEKYMDHCLVNQWYKKLT